MFILNAITSLIMQYQNFANLNAQTSTLHCTVLSSSWPKSKSQQNSFFFISYQQYDFEINLENVSILGVCML